MVRIVAHRGASATHPENTLAAFAAAREAGADGVELDVRLSKDEVLIVNHDAHLADGRLVRDVTAAEMPPSVPTLAEAIETVGDLWLNVEIKNVPDEPDYDQTHRISMAVAGLVAAFLATPDEADSSPADRVIVSSFNVDSVKRIRQNDAGIPLALLVWGQADIASLIARAAGHGFEAIHPQDILVDRAFVERAHDAGLQVNVWTVDDPARVVELAGFGVDGIITNDPAKAVAAVGAARSR